MEKPKNAAEMIDLLDEFFAMASYEDCTKVWNILTALRGPDDADPNDKQLYTVPIRRMALPLVARAHDLDGTIVPAAMLGSSWVAVIPDNRPQTHFLSHIQYAHESLIEIKNQRKPR